MNNLLYAIMTIFAQWFNVCIQNLEATAPFAPSPATRLATVTGGCVVLILLLQLQTRRKLTPAMKRHFGDG